MVHHPRSGSLQFWPRKRANKILPSANWKILENAVSDKKILGFVGYKVGMLSALVKDNTPNSITKGKQIVMPVTIIECPPMKILSIRFYKNGIPATEMLAENLDKNLARKIKIPKKKSNIEEIETLGNKVSGAPKISEFSSEKLSEYDNLRLIVYTSADKTGLKKSPDIIEVGVSGKIEDKFKIAKEMLGKEINFSDAFSKGQVVDAHVVTKGKGTQGPVKRFGITLKPHKTEKGVRRPGSLGPWHPAKVIFRVPMAGQVGFFTRVQNNNKLIDLNKKEDYPFQHYGNIKTNFCIIKGSIGGPIKRPLLLTFAARPSKKIEKENFELVRLIK